MAVGSFDKDICFLIRNISGFRNSFLFIPSVGNVQTGRMKKIVPPTIAHRDTLPALVPLSKDAYMVFIQ